MEIFLIILGVAVAVDLVGRGICYLFFLKDEYKPKWMFWSKK